MMDNQSSLPPTIADLPLEAQVNVMFEVAPYLQAKIKQHCDLGDQTEAQGLLQVLRFLALINDNTPAVLTPSERVDQIWHQLILCTKLYSQYCTTLYRQYLHHTPSDETQQNHQQFELCLQQYHQRFGQPDPWFWGAPLLVSTAGACSGCES
ncbi:MAG: hypothetical protein ACI8WB_000344 [Phenylobacterium sp.]|jgi:hypothetical protein